MTAPTNHRPDHREVRHRLTDLLDEHLDRADECAPDDPAREAHLAAAMQVNAAIERVDNGIYGICRRCKHPIAPERLEAVPAAALCIHCAEIPRASLL